MMNAEMEPNMIDMKLAEHNGTLHFERAEGPSGKSPLVKK
jgi:hypothetical protein